MGSLVRIILVSAMLFGLSFSVEAGQGGRQNLADASGRIKVYTYDEAGRIVAVTDASGKTTHLGQSPANPTEHEGKINNQVPATQTATLAPKIIHVPTDQPTIQAAIDAAVNGDTVLVADGTYKENINFKGKAITVTSVHGVLSTFIDGGGLDSVVKFVTQEGPTSVLNGFTVQNGLAAGLEGSGILVSNSSPRITFNRITGNAGCDGLGIGIDFGSPVVQGNIITKNKRTNCSGGNGGGGILIIGSSTAQIINNTITGNIAGDGVGGGGISMFAAGSPTIRANIIAGNSVDTMGGGIGMVNDENAVIVENLIAQNTAPQGGGIAPSVPNDASGPIIVNNTVVEDSGVNGGSEIFLEGFYSHAQFFNNIFVGTAGQTAVFCDNLFSSQLPIFKFNNAFNAQGTAYGGICTSETGMNGNISADPKFVSAPASNFHLQTGSPAIDAGDNSAPSLPSKDLDGFPRIENGTVDMGVYEFFLTTNSVAPSSLTFTTELIGTKSAAQPVEVMNTGTMPLFLGIGITGDFLQSNNCPARVAPSSSCTVNVSFKPTALGARTGELLFGDNASTSPQSVLLSGTGQGFPIVSLSTTSLTFGLQVLGTTSASKNVILKNTGTAALAISSIISSGDFTIPVKTCGTSLAPQTACTISVAFKPSAVGVRSGAVSITDSASGSPHIVSLSGTATAVTLSTSALNFSPQLLGTTSAGRTVMITNHSAGTLSFAGITISGTNAADFVRDSQTCSASLAGNSSCSVTVKFRPSVTGPETATLSFSDNGGASPQMVSMTGTGTVVTLTRSSITFPPQAIGTTSAPQSVTLTNHGTGILDINTVSIIGTNSGDFLISFDSCPPDLVANANCTVSVEFHPTATGTRTASLAFSDNGAASPQLVKLTGTGQ